MEGVGPADRSGAPQPRGLTSTKAPSAPHLGAGIPVSSGFRKERGGQLAGRESSALLSQRPLSSSCGRRPAYRNE